MIKTIHTECLVNSIKNMDTVASITGPVIDVNTSESTAEIARQNQTPHDRLVETLKEIQMNKIHTEGLTNPTKNTDTVASITGPVIDATIAEAEIARQNQIPREQHKTTQVQILDEPPLTGNPSNLPLRGEQDAPRLSEIAQENSAPIDLVETEVATPLTDDIADTVINDEANTHATTNVEDFSARETITGNNTPLLDAKNTECEAESASLAEAPHTKSNEKRNKRRTKAEEKDLTDTVLQLLENGHDPLAIALYLKESKTTVNNIMVGLITSQRFIYTPPEYTILGGGHFILNIKELGITKDGHVHIKRNANGELVIRAFDPNELTQDAFCESFQA